MPITQITLENFKGVANTVTVPLRPITLLFGPNSAGKSTLLQALLYLRELLENQNADADVLPASGSSINLGGFRQFVHGHDLSRTVRLGVTVTVDDDGLPDYYESLTEDGTPDLVSDFIQDGIESPKTVGVQVAVQWHSDTMKPWVVDYSVAINGTSIGRIFAQPNQLAHLEIWRTPESNEMDAHSNSSEPVQLLEPNPETFRVGSRVIPALGHVFPEFEFAGEGTFARLMQAYETGADGEPSIIDAMLLGTRHEAYRLSRIFVGAADLVVRELQRIRYIGPIREIPSRSFAAQLSPDVSRWSNGAAAWDWLHSNPGLLTEITAKEIQSLGLGYRIEPYRTFAIPSDSRLGVLIERARLGDTDAFDDLSSLPPNEFLQLKDHSRVRIVAEETGVEVAPCDIGVGVAQVLPVVVGSMVPGYSVLAVEQPELHVHPAVQTRLADVLARQVVGTQDRLLLLETHSEHLMLRLLRRIREHQEGESEPGAPEIKPEHLSVLYLSNEGGAMQITELPVTPDGDFSRPWPKGFFEERSAELF